MLVAPLWEESVNVQACYGINSRPNQRQQLQEQKAVRNFARFHELRKVTLHQVKLSSAGIPG